jgi:phycoerythrin-associated linker protein
MVDISQFIEQSVGRWRSQRSAHHLTFAHFEAVESMIQISALAPDDPAVLALCKSYQLDPASAVSPFRMSWQGQSDWEDSEAIQGTCVLVPIPDATPRQGRLLRDQGYAETIAAVGRYHFTEDDTFVLVTQYDRAAAEEKIWFATPNLRCRVALTKTSDGTGVVQASFASELRLAAES